MRLVTFTRRGYPSIGKLVGREAVDVCSVPGLPRTMRQLLKGRQVLLARVCELQAGDASTFALTDVGLEAPVEPGKYLAIGLNYRDHVAEANQIGFNVPDGVVAWIVVWAKDPFARQSQEAPAVWRTELGRAACNLRLSTPRRWRLRRVGPTGFGRAGADQ